MAATPFFNVDDLITPEKANLKATNVSPSPQFSKVEFDVCSLITPPDHHHHCCSPSISRNPAAERDSTHPVRKKSSLIPGIVDALCSPKQAPPILSNMSQFPRAAAHFAADDARANEFYSNLTCSQEQNKQPRQRRTDQERANVYTSHDYALQVVYKDTVQDYEKKFQTVCSCFDKRCQKIFRDQDKLASLHHNLANIWENTDKDHRRSKMAADLLMGLRHDGDSKNWVQEYFIADELVCRSFYLHATGFGSDSVRKMINELREREEKSVANIIKEGDMSAVRDRLTPKRDAFVAFIEVFAESFADALPDEDVKVLPYRSIDGIYQEFEQEHQARGFRKGDYIGYSQACHVFKTQIPHIRLARNKGTFSTCKICDNYQIRILASKSKDERDKLKAMRKEHVAKQRKERDAYYIHRERAIMYPESYLSIIIDGMGQDKTNLPIGSSKIELGKNLEQRIVGVKVHGVKNYTFVLEKSVRGGANLMADVLRRVLLDLEKLGKLPTRNPTLYVQFDNCSENKNKTLFSFLDHLVESGVFKTVNVGFLMKGHTHDDIDQFFSVISKHLRKATTICPDIATFVAELKKAFVNSLEKPDVQRILARDIFDYDQMYGGTNDVAGMKDPHQFKMEKYSYQLIGSNGIQFTASAVLTHYKQWSYTKQWLPEVYPDEAEQQGDVVVEVAMKKKRKATSGQLKKSAKRSKKLLVDEEVPVQHHAKTAELFPASTKEVQNTLFGPIPQGIKWVQSYPNLESAPFVSFTQAQEQQFLNHANAVYRSIIRYAHSASVFSEDVLKNWDAWIEEQKWLWDVDNNHPTHGTMAWPTSFHSRSSGRNSVQVRDCAEPDYAEGKEYVAHKSGIHGTTTANERMKVRREHTFEQLSAFIDNDRISAGTFVLYKYDFTDEDDNSLKSNVGLGKIIKVYNEEIFGTGENIIKFDLKFCPPKQGKKVTNADLYRNIKVDDLFSTKYNLPIVHSQPQEVLLATGLTLNANGSFSKRDRKHKWFNKTSAEVYTL